MKKLTVLLMICCIIFGLLGGCSAGKNDAEIVATTLPVYDFTLQLCDGTGLSVKQLVNEPVSCLHNYTLQVSQMKTVESADLLIMTGAGYEDFLQDVFASKEENLIDCSKGIELAQNESSHHDETHEGHHHKYDPHIWMSPANAKIMAENIAEGLIAHYTEQESTITKNLHILCDQLDELQRYGEQQLASLKSKDLITFHNGFHYFADSFGLRIVKSIEEEPGSETSAAELENLISYVKENNLPAIFTERNGSDSSAKVIASETGCKIQALDMIMYGKGYFDAMYYNIDTVKEALG